jgi:hypothetical protein
MKVSEKSLELNVGTELLNLFRTSWGLPKTYLRGLTQKEERQEGVDFFLQLDPATRLFAFQFKAPKGKYDAVPYRYTLEREQHNFLFGLSQLAANSVFYVFPFYVTPTKLQADVPELLRDTWLLRIEQVPTAQVFGPQLTCTVRCQSGIASINPEYKMLNMRQSRDLESKGIAIGEFASWYKDHLSSNTQSERRRRSPWLVRGLRLVMAIP